MTRTKNHPAREVEIDAVEDLLKEADHPLAKIDPEAEVEEESDELASEEVGLDEEDLNPFGDKWEQ